MPEQVVIVTGGGTGIGRAAAIRFAQAGAWVVIAGRRVGPLEETASLSDRIVPVSADVLHPDDLSRLIQTAISRWDRIHILVNNAGAFVQRSLETIDASMVTSLLNTNILAPSLLCQAALPYLKATQGSIVNISSTFGHKAAPMIAHYAASKAALEQLTRCWALELAPYRIRVNAVAPGPTETEILERSGMPADVVRQLKANEAAQVPLGRRGTADDIADWIVHLANASASWITGQVIAVDGGLSVA